MKLAVVSSLQGHPEETSPETPMDTTRLARYIAEYLQERFSPEELEVGLYSRETHPDLKGDAYIELRNRLVRWGADAAVHIHQDAGAERGARGWHVIYYWPDAATLVNELLAALAHVPSPMRYGGAVHRAIAATRAPRTSVLIEAGFYTSTEDEAIGVAGWGDAIVRGIANWLVRHRGCRERQKQKEDEKVVDLVRQELQEQGQGIFAGKSVDVWTGYGGADDYLHLRINAPETRKVVAFLNVCYPAPRDLKPLVLDCDSWRGRVIKLSDMGLKSGEFAWVAVHLLPEDSKRFRGFLRS